MEQHIISPKLLLSVLLLGIIILVTSVVSKYISFSPHIIICNESSGTTYIIKTSRTYEIVIPTSAMKDTVTCMGRGMAFYDRTADVIFMKKKNESFISQLEKRYTIGEVITSSLKYQGIELAFDGERILLQNQGSTYALYSKSVTNPFELVRTEQNSDLSYIVGPELESVIQTIIKQNPQAISIPFIPMRIGEYKTIKLGLELQEKQVRVQ